MTTKRAPKAEPAPEPDNDPAPAVPGQEVVMGVLNSVLTEARESQLALNAAVARHKKAMSNVDTLGDMGLPPGRYDGLILSRNETRKILDQAAAKEMLGNKAPMKDTNPGWTITPVGATETEPTES